MRHPTRLAAHLLLALLAATAPAAQAEEPPEYQLAVVPSVAPVELHRAWTPFVERLSREVGVRIRPRFFSGMGAFLEECGSGGPDLIFANPNVFYVAHRANGYVPLVRARAPVRGAVFVRTDSPYRSVRDLHGRSIAFSGPANLCAVLVRNALSTGGPAIGFRPEFVGSSANVIKSVLLGKSDAGAILDSALASDQTAGAIRTILETALVAPHPLAAHPRVPAAVRERIVSAILVMGGNDEGRRLLAAVGLSDPVRPDYDRDYRYFEAIDLERIHGGSP